MGLSIWLDVIFSGIFLILLNLRILKANRQCSWHRPEYKAIPPELVIALIIMSPPEYPGFPLYAYRLYRPGARSSPRTHKSYDILKAESGILSMSVIKAMYISSGRNSLVFRTTRGGDKQ